MPENFTLSKYRVPRATLLTGLGATDVQDFSWIGSGPEGYWLVEHTGTEVSGVPHPAMTREDRFFTKHPFMDFKNQFFPTVNPEIFESLRVEMNSTYVWFDLHKDGS